MEQRLLLGITGGIAAYKTPILIRLFKKQGVDVRVVATAHAFEFVTRVTLEALSGNPVLRDMFAERQNSFEHIELAKWAEVMVVAPATANIIAKFAGGIADDLLSTTFVTIKRPVLIAPAMNDAMFADYASQKNLRNLKQQGVLVCEPASGQLACGVEGTGRMAEPEEIFERAMLLFRDRSLLAGKKVLVTAGATRERIDPVRFISNRSSGKMGYAIAEAFLMYGAEVTLVSGPASLIPPPGADFVGIESAKEMHEAVMSRAARQDIIVKSAAVADYTPAEVSSSKIKKKKEGLLLELVRTPDILGALGASKQAGQILIGFAAETNDHLENAVDKMKRKNLDMIVLNDVSASDAGFAVETNRVLFVRPLRADEKPEGWKTMKVKGAGVLVKATPLLTKHAIADELVKQVLELIC
jgi:phosphopantothenoylcysteine decarboxylase / phosphopantothenate---cysteine ligase